MRAPATGDTLFIRGKYHGTTPETFHSRAGLTCAFSEPVHLKNAQEKACLTAPDNSSKLSFALIRSKHTRFMYRLNWLYLK